MSKENFKLFVKKTPNLVKHVNANEITWQKLYEMYELYGENSEVWDKYKASDTATKVADKITSGERSVKELINMVKNMDMEKVRQGIDGVQKAIGLIQDMGLGSKKTPTSAYQARPIYKHFDD